MPTLTWALSRLCLLATGRNYHGGDFALSINPTRYLRLLLFDFGIESGHSAFSGEGSLTTAQALFGPEFVLRHRHINGFVHGLFGFAQYDLGACATPCQFPYTPPPVLTRALEIISH